MNAPASIHRPEIGEQARNRWPGILAHFGVDQTHLSGKQSPCPICGGRDRFRFDNLDGRGTWICNSCGAGDGMKLLLLKKGWQFKEAAGHIRTVLGEIPPSRPRRKIDQARAMRLCSDLWGRSGPIGDDEAAAYLRSRGFSGPYPEALRYCGAAEVKGHPTRSTLPAMLALVSDPDGRPVNVHRTYLEHGRKAEWADPQTGEIVSARKMMPGELPDGSAIRLGPAQGRLGIAEGIETALGAAALQGIPVWSAVNSTMLEKFAPPAGLSELHIFGDNDAKFGGQAAAYRLAHRVATKPRAPSVIVHVPERTGTDWADLWAEDCDARG